MASGGKPILEVAGLVRFLGDFDLNSGMVRFMLKLKNTYSVVDAAERSLDIDENFWPQLVTSIGALDVLQLPFANQVGARLELVRRQDVRLDPGVELLGEKEEAA